MSRSYSFFSGVNNLTSKYELCQLPDFRPCCGVFQRRSSVVASPQQVQTVTTGSNESMAENAEKQQQDLIAPGVLDEGGNEVEVPKKKPLAFYLAFLAINISTFVVSLDATALAVAIPKITNELNGTTLEAFWTSLAFILAVVVVQPLYTSISDVVGRKEPFCAGFVFFAIGSVVFAVANNMAVLIVGRLLQGLGAGGLDVLSEVILVDMTSLKERPKYLGFFALPMAGGAVFGPIIGASFSEYVDWRWIGWVNLPFCAIATVLTIFFMRLRPIDQKFSVKIQRLDWIGMVLFAIGCTLFSLPLSWAGVMYPWNSWRTLLPFLIGVLLLLIFALYESKPMEPVFPYRIFSNRTAAATIIGGTIHGMILYSTTNYGPLFFQAILLQSPFKSAISVLPGSVSVIGFSIIAAIVVEVVRRYRWIIIVAWVFAASGIGLWALWGDNSSLAVTASTQIIFGIGVGTLFTVLTIPMQTSVKDVDDTGIAAGALVSFRLFGGLIGLSICAGVFNNVFEQNIGSLGQLPPSSEKLKDIREVIGFIPILRVVAIDMEPGTLMRILDVYRKAFFAVFLTLGGMGAVGFLVSLFTKEISMESEDMGRQALEDSS
ncbi:hypothetical protein HYFRA_00009510 [Hymenoscyphus fraxineus]|uniref:Major facilitator superfamily (MFS) profile domain-containing protein n=1 Tax=Hymenoscyphus fraxineus TaxID=746836 RepID=A0A9N9KX68_9HELO|nr:hypothetical protein HYFRA_00009510 [Hymenoscyphus fraxineus]